MPGVARAASLLNAASSPETTVSPSAVGSLEHQQLLASLEHNGLELPEYRIEASSPRADEASPLINDGASPLVAIHWRIIT